VLIALGSVFVVGCSRDNASERTRYRLGDLQSSVREALPSGARFEHSIVADDCYGADTQPFIESTVTVSNALVAQREALAALSARGWSTLPGTSNATPYGIGLSHKAERPSVVYLKPGSSPTTLKVRVTFHCRPEDYGS
jgi:hypothetical protein